MAVRAALQDRKKGVSVAEWRQKFAQRDAQSLSYFDIGPSEASALLFCHGLGANADQFESDALYFADKGYRVIAPDLRGHGRSALSKSATESDFTIDALTRDLVCVLDAAKAQKVSYIGNSLGGILGLSLMADHKDRLDRFASFGTAYSLDTPGFAVRLLPAMHRLLGHKLVAYIGAKGASKKPSTQEFVRRMFLSSDPEAVTRIIANLGNYNLIENAVQFGKPMLMLRGEHDSSINSKLGPTLEAMQPLSNFQMVDIADAGHCANLDASEAVRREILRFVASSKA